MINTDQQSVGSWVQWCFLSISFPSRAVFFFFYLHIVWRWSKSQCERQGQKSVKENWRLERNTNTASRTWTLSIIKNSEKKKRNKQKRNRTELEHYLWPLSWHSTPFLPFLKRIFFPVCRCVLSSSLTPLNPPPSLLSLPLHWKINALPLYLSELLGFGRVLRPSGFLILSNQPARNGWWWWDLNFLWDGAKRIETEAVIRQALFIAQSPFKHTQTRGWLMTICPHLVRFIHRTRHAAQICMPLCLCE